MFYIYIYTLNAYNFKFKVYYQNLKNSKNYIKKILFMSKKQNKNN